jgi:hypothetical protein
MNDLGGRKVTKPRLLLWIARISALAIVALLIPMAMGGEGEPTGAAEWAYLALFPFGFSFGYLIGWRWPLIGGYVSLACMAISLVVIGRLFDWGAYLTWGVLCVPGVLYVMAGLKLRGAGDGEVPGP